jgi:phage regulator Rha-like protein
MSNLILTPRQISVSLENKEGELRLDSRIVCQGFGLKSHKDYRYQILEKYEKQFTELGGVLKTPLENGEIVWFLNEAQVNFAGTLARNTDKAVEFKFNLVKAFELAKQIIPAQNDRIRELELEVELEREKNKGAARQDIRIAMYGLATTLMLEGKSDSVVEIDRPTIEVIDVASGAKFSGQTTKQLAEYLNKHGGRNFKSGAELERELAKLGRSDLIDTVPRKSLQPFVSKENLEEACKILKDNRQQKLLGE